MGIKNVTSAVFAEPLLHFAVIGAVVFLIAGQSGSAGSVVVRPDTVIDVSAEDIARLSAQFAATWNRSPTEQEVAGLVESHIRDEVLYREAIALGLDDGDAVIRQRLRLKMEFIGESVAATLEPDDAELAAWYDAHSDQFRPPARLAFRQVMIGGPEEAEAVLAALSQGADPETLGRASLLPATVGEGTQAAIDGAFGPGFFEAVAALPPGTWVGPVESSYGQHVVMMTSIDRLDAPPLADVRDAVVAAWRQAQAETLREAQYLALRARYEIRLPDSPESAE